MGGLTYTFGHDHDPDRLCPLLTDKQDLDAQKAVLEKLGVAPGRIYTDRGLTGTNRSRPGLDQALAAVRAGDTLVVPKLDRLARWFRCVERRPVSGWERRSHRPRIRERCS